MILVPNGYSFSGSTPFPGLNALYPTIGSALIHPGRHRKYGRCRVAAYFDGRFPVLRRYLILSLSLALADPGPHARLLWAELAGQPWGSLAAGCCSSFRPPCRTDLVEQPFMHVRTADFPFLLRRGHGDGCRHRCSRTLHLRRRISGPLLTGHRRPLRCRGGLQSEARPNATTATTLRCLMATIASSEQREARGCWPSGATVTEPSWLMRSESRSRDLRMNVLEITSSACPPALNYAPPGPALLRRGTTTSTLDRHCQ